MYYEYTSVRYRRSACLRAAEVVATGVASTTAAGWQAGASCWLVICADKRACVDNSVVCALIYIFSPVVPVDVGQHRLRAVSHVNPVPHVVPTNYTVSAEDCTLPTANASSSWSLAIAAHSVDRRRADDASVGRRCRAATIGGDIAREANTTRLTCDANANCRLQCN